MGEFILRVGVLTSLERKYQSVHQTLETFCMFLWTRSCLTRLAQVGKQWNPGLRLVSRNARRDHRRLRLVGRKLV